MTKLGTQGKQRLGSFRIGYVQVKSPDEPPACQVDDAASAVAVKSPAGPEGPAVTARRVDGTTSAETVRDFVLLVEASGLGRQPAASGVVVAHSGSWTSRSRVDQSAP